MGRWRKASEVESGTDVDAQPREAETRNAKKGKRKKTPADQLNRQATIRETLSFVLNAGGKSKLLFILGSVGGLGNGMVYPAIAWIFSTSFSDLGGTSQNGLGPIKEIAFWLLGIGVYALVISMLQTACFEVAAYEATQSLKLQWFQALLRQDVAFFDVHDVGGIATSITPAANRYRRGVGRKFGEGIQFFTTGVGGIAFALYSEWRVALLVLSFCPVVAFFATGLVTINQSKSARSGQAYSKAGSIAYSTVSGIKTVLSLNAISRMVSKYNSATEDAFKIATKPLIRQGFTAGMMLGSFLIMYIILTLYGSYVIYKDVFATGCDPSGVFVDNETCDTSGEGVFGAMLGIAFAAQGISQVGTFLETFTSARVAAGQAVTAINRKPGQPEQKIYHPEESNGKDGSRSDGEDNESVVGENTSSRHSSDMIESPEGRIRAILPAYEIDSMSSTGLRPTDVEGELTFEDVRFNYPTRPGHTILNGLSIDIPAGKTVAFVGPSGGGKSTVVKLLERFYDPLEGCVRLDGIDIKKLNVKHLRSMIGYVGQEPALFATTIAKNISYGAPNCSHSEIVKAAKLANAHDFITHLPNGYETQVGDKGSQLSGGQKQRIAIARVLVGNPKILLLDEATSALDSQSELVVQEALENIISTEQRTTVIIAHRLSTIRNADIIAVVMGGTIVETGTHDKLMMSETYYKKLVDTQGSAAMMPRDSSVPNLGQLAKAESQIGFEKVPERLAKEDAMPLIVFRSVSFSYPTRPNRMILDKFKLKIYQGETIGLCGISGGGKSTVMGLIERFYDPEEGKVEYFGEDVKKLNVRWYRDQIGYVGQEPTLFDATIAENIAFGAPSATRKQIESAAKQANAYDFIMDFPDKFDTVIAGGSGTQLSGGQKQRIAIARALVKKPEILLLDEATSALDNESERIVQEALDKLMESKDHTCVVIAHRLSTIRNADRIAFIGDGRVKEIGSHDELMEKPNGKYKRLVESQARGASTALHGLVSKSKKKKKSKVMEDVEEEEGNLDQEIEKEELSAFDIKRARRLAKPDKFYLMVGAIGSLMAGSIFPMWGVLFANTMDILYYPVEECNERFLLIWDVFGFETCQDYYDRVGNILRDESFTLSIYWVILVVVCLTGNMLTFWGFGNASERMNRRVRDDAFRSLVRQEVSFFDKRSVGTITSELQEDATRIQTFTGDPIRSFLTAGSSVLIGVTLSFFYMWEFAIVALACVPVMGIATSLEMKQMFGEDEGAEETQEEASSPGGIIVETLLNMGTVSALTMEEERYKNYQIAMANDNENYVWAGVREGVMAGLSMFIQQWINALQIYYGGWLLYRFPEKYVLNDYLVSNFAILFSLFGLGSAFQDIADRKETEKSAGRIFYLLDRTSAIDPLSDKGKTLTKQQKRSKSMRRVRSSRSRRAMADGDGRDDSKRSSRSLSSRRSKSSRRGSSSKKDRRSSRRVSSKNADAESGDDDVASKGSSRRSSRRSLEKKKSSRRKKREDP